MNTRIIENNIETAKFVCSCGWTSYSNLYTLKYHAEHHNCTSAKWTLARQNKELNK